MKAKINDVEIEGTPGEILEFISLKDNSESLIKKELVRREQEQIVHRAYFEDDNKIIRNMLKSGFNHEQIGTELCRTKQAIKQQAWKLKKHDDMSIAQGVDDLRKNHIRVITRKLKIVSRQTRKRVKPSERKAILKRLKEGVTLECISKEFNRSIATLYSIVKRAGKTMKQARHTYNFSPETMRIRKNVCIERNKLASLLKEQYPDWPHGECLREAVRQIKIKMLSQGEVK